MSYNLYEDVKETPIYTKEEIQAVVSRMGAEISRDYADKNPVMISVLRGAFVFMADLVRAVTVPCEIDFMAVSSYGAGTESSGRVRILKDLDTNIGNYSNFYKYTKKNKLIHKYRRPSCYYCRGRSR